MLASTYFSSKVLLFSCSQGVDLGRFRSFSQKQSFNAATNYINSPLDEVLVFRSSNSYLSFITNILYISHLLLYPPCCEAEDMLSIPESLHGLGEFMMRYGLITQHQAVISQPLKGYVQSNVSASTNLHSP